MAAQKLIRSYNHDKNFGEPIKVSFIIKKDCGCQPSLPGANIVNRL